MLHKAEKQVRYSEVVVRDGVWDHRGPFTSLRAPEDPLVAAKSLCKRLADHKNK